MTCPSSSTVLVSRAGGVGAVGDGDSRQPALDEDGDVVAFTSAAKNLETVGTSDDRVYRRQIGAGDAVTLVSRKSAALGDAPTFGTQPAISDDGARIAFTAPGSVAPDPQDTNQQRDVYVRDAAHRGDGARQPRGRQRRDHRQRRLRRAGDGG